MVKRLSSSQIGEKAIYLVGNIFNEANWVCNRLYHDFGIDLHVKVFESEVVTPWEFHAQIKGTKNPRISKGYVHFSIDTDHLKSWQDSLLPVLFVVCDVRSGESFWLWVKQYLNRLDSDWPEQSTVTLQIPVSNQLTPEVLHRLCADLKRDLLMREAKKVIALIEEPDEANKSSFGFSSPYYRPLPDLDPSIENPVLGQCMLCSNYFWIEESTAASWEFIKIYEPNAWEPAVYSCDAPEMLCPICSNGQGALEKCKNCGRYNVFPDDEYHEDGDNPLINQDEAKHICLECFEDLTKLRKYKSQE